MSKDEIFAGVSQEWRDILDNDDLDTCLAQISTCDDLVPCASHIFEFARRTPLSSIKVVILGQDPYPKQSDAHGLAFSCMTHVPASLKNIYRCLMHSGLINSMPDTGDLTYWAKQGVLLLNCSLTATVGKSNVHRAIWKKYTDRLIQTLSQQTSQVGTTKFYRIFMLWGGDAKSKKRFIHERCKILEWTHPSPLSVAGGHPFKTCPHFIKANKLLRHIGGIDWNVCPPLSIVNHRFNLQDGCTVVFTDGSCSPNKRCKEAVAGYAAIFVLGAFQDTVIYGNLDTSKKYASNQRAEGFAIYQTMVFLQNHISEWDSVIFVSDSDFWIKMIEQYMPAWEEQSLDFKEKANADLTRPMWELYTQLIYVHEKKIEFRHVASHNKSGWKDKPSASYEKFCYDSNDLADRFAGYAREQVSPGDLIIEPLQTE